jgi:hypothetical protein
VAPIRAVPRQAKLKARGRKDPRTSPPRTPAHARVTIAQTAQPVPSPTHPRHRPQSPRALTRDLSFRRTEPGSYATMAEHEAALLKAGRDGLVAIRIIKAPYPNWRELYDELTQDGDAEGNVWHCDAARNDALRVVAPSGNQTTCWFTIFLPHTVHAELHFSKGAYDMGRVKGKWAGTFATVDYIWGRRGSDYGAVVEVTSNRTHNQLGFQAIEDDNGVELWRLLNEVTGAFRAKLNLGDASKITMRTRYRPKKRAMIIAILAQTTAQQMSVEHRAMAALKALKGAPLEVKVRGRTFRITDFQRAECAHAPLNEKRIATQQSEDEELQGRKCTISNLPSDANSARLLNVFRSRNWAVVGDILVLDSRHVRGTRIAYVQFADEEIAFRAIVDAPSMVLSGKQPTIKATKPKGGRSLTVLEKDELTALDLNGPADGMTPSQVTELLSLLKKSPPGQADDLSHQFRFDQEGSFANLLLDKIRTEFSGLTQEVTAGHNKVWEQIGAFHRDFMELAELNDERAEATEARLQSLSDDNRATVSGLYAQMLEMNKQSLARDADHRLDMELITERLNAIQGTLAPGDQVPFGSPYRAAQQPGYEPQGSDDDEELQCDDSTLAEDVRRGADLFPLPDSPQRRAPIFSPRAEHGAANESGGAVRPLLGATPSVVAPPPPLWPRNLRSAPRPPPTCERQPVPPRPLPALRTRRTELHPVPSAGTVPS